MFSDFVFRFRNYRIAFEDLTMKAEASYPYLLYNRIAMAMLPSFSPRTQLSPFTTRW